MGLAKNREKGEKMEMRPLQFRIAGGRFIYGGREVQGVCGLLEWHDPRTYRYSRSSKKNRIIGLLLSFNG